MLVCHCRAVNDRVVRDLIDLGASDVVDIGRRCGAGTGCGGCRSVLDELLHERLSSLALTS